MVISKAKPFERGLELYPEYFKVLNHPTDLAFLKYLLEIKYALPEIYRTNQTTTFLV